MGRGKLSDEQAAHLQSLSADVGGWIAWGDQDHGEVFVAMEEWTARFYQWKTRDTPLSLERWITGTKRYPFAKVIEQEARKDNIEGKDDK